MTKKRKAKKKRATILPKSVLIVVEGQHGVAVVRYLKKLYVERNSGFSFDIKSGKGGSPSDVVHHALKKLGNYDHSVVIFDNDKGEDQYNAAVNLAGRYVEIVPCEPCLEYELLCALEGKKNIGLAKSSCSSYKSQFEKKYVPSNHRAEPDAYSRITKNLVEAVCQTNPFFQRLKGIFQGEIDIL